MCNPTLHVHCCLFLYISQETGLREDILVMCTSSYLLSISHMNSYNNFSENRMSWWNERWVTAVSPNRMSLAYEIVKENNENKWWNLIKFIGSKIQNDFNALCMFQLLYEEKKETVHIISGRVTAVLVDWVISWPVAANIFSFIKLYDHLENWDHRKTSLDTKTWTWSQMKHWTQQALTALYLLIWMNVFTEQPCLSNSWRVWFLSLWCTGPGGVVATRENVKCGCANHPSPTTITTTTTSRGCS